MKKLIMLLSIVLFNHSFCMEDKIQDQPYHDFKKAIVEGKKNKVLSFLTPLIELDVLLNNPEEPEMTSISLALQSNQSKCAKKLVKFMNDQIENLQNALLFPFEDFAKKGDTDHLHQLMAMEEMTQETKKQGCWIALDVSCEKNNVALAKILVTQYEEYIVSPCTNTNFQNVAINHFEKHQELIDTILRHPNAAKSISYLLEARVADFPNQQEKYEQLIKRAKYLKNNTPLNEID